MKKLENLKLSNTFAKLGADLRETNITKDQIKFAFTNEDTLLPNYISNKKKHELIVATSKK